MVYSLLFVSFLLQNLHPTVITTSFEIAFTSNNTLVTYWSVHFIIRMSLFFGGCSADKNSAANSAIGVGLGV